MIDDEKAVLDALERAKADAKKHREALQALQTEHDSLTDDLATLKGAHEALQAAQSEAQAQRDSEATQAEAWRLRALGGLARGALRDAGGDDRAMKYLDMSGVTFDGDKVTGLTEAIGRVQTDLPELFGKRRVAGQANAHERSDAPARSVTEKQADALYALGQKKP